MAMAQMDLLGKVCAHEDLILIAKCRSSKLLFEVLVACSVLIYLRLGSCLSEATRPVRVTRKLWKLPQQEVHPPILWPNGFKYDGQLLRLALDLAQRLLPAFYTDTGIPYPRVNLRHGIPFYQNSPLNRDSNVGECSIDGSTGNH